MSISSVMSASSVGGYHQPAWSGRSPPTQHLRALVDGVLDQLLDVLAALLGGQRADVGALLHRVADGERRTSPW